MIGIGLIGYGYWGPQLARNFASLSQARLVAICDAQASRRALASQQHPAVQVVSDVTALLSDANIHAVVIATPVSSHFELARACLAAGRHVLVEKPLAASSAQAETLCALARQRGLVLLVDHTFLYSSAVQQIKATLDAGGLGEVFYFDSVRTNLGRFRSDVDVIWDLASHDLAIVQHVFADAPDSIQATGLARDAGQPLELAYLTLRWGQRRIAHIHVSWLTPIKVRRTMVGGARGMLLWDDIDPDTKIRIYAVGPDDGPVSGANADAEQLRISFRRGDMHAPWLPIAEPLRTLAEHFVACMAEGCAPRSGGAAGAQVLRWLEAARVSLEGGGAPVTLMPALS